MELKINTIGTFKLDILEQRHDYIKSRAEYENGFILITEQTPNVTNVSHSHNFIHESDGSLTPDMTSPNPNFVDVN